jgi:hypothetical protein
VNAIHASLGVYSVPDAARITRVAPRLIRGWLQGLFTTDREDTGAPMLRRQHDLRDGELASWLPWSTPMAAASSWRRRKRLETRPYTIW